jgi:phosphate-selective porin OprO/OprP
VGLAGITRAGTAQRDTTAARQQPTVGAGREGFVIKSADGAFQLKLRAYVQADGRFFPGGAATLGTSTFFLRRARSVTDVTLWKYFALRLTPDFGQGRVVLFDAYLDFRPATQFGLRAGKTKPPIGLERLQSATDLRFVERGLPTDLVPNRDVGLQAFGDLAGGQLSYAIGVFNGVADLGNGWTSCG